MGPGISTYGETLNDLCDLPEDKKASPVKYGFFALAGGSGVLSERRIKYNTGVLVCLFSLVISISVSLAFGIETFAVTVIGLCLATAYSLYPFRMKNKPIIGQFLLGLGYGPVAIIIGITSISNLNQIGSELIIFFGLVFGWVVSVGLTADILDLKPQQDSFSNNLADLLGYKKALLFTQIIPVIIIGLTLIFKAIKIIEINNLFIFIVGLFLIMRIILLNSHYSKRLQVSHLLAIGLEATYPLLLILW